MTGPTSTVSGRIHSRLRADILDGRYAVGEALPSERRLSEELASSRHGVREALKRLQQAGLVSISQGGATRVRDWRQHGGLELLLDLAPMAMRLRRCMRRGRRWRCARASAPTRRGGAPSARTRRCKAQLVARAEQLAAVEDLDARNAHYEVLWDLIVEGADNIAYRLALTTLVARAADRRGGLATRSRRNSRTSRPFARSPRGIADGRREPPTQRAELLERSIPVTWPRSSTTRSRSSCCC